MKYLFTLFTVVGFMPVQAQNYERYTRDSAAISNCRKDVIKLDNAAASPGARPNHLPFSRFIFKDVTADSGYVGVEIRSNALSKQKNYNKAILENGVAVSLTNYLNTNPNFLFTRAGVALTCFVKQLRITEIDSLNKLTNNRERFRRMRFETEAYLTKGDLFYPAIRLDTIAISFSVDNNDYSVLTDVLHAFAAKAASADTGKIFKRNGHPLAEIDKRYRQRFYKPILQATYLTRGVYKTFGEFINNSPSILQYELKSDKKSTILYTKTGNNDWMPERKAFGFCDGEVLWISVGNVFNPLVRQGNTFEFLTNYYSNYIPSKKRSGVIIGDSPLATFGASAVALAMNDALLDNGTGKIVYQLNMDDGSFY